MAFHRPLSLDGRKILFLTGTRADFGKMKSLIRAVDQSGEFDCRVFVTGMHTLELYGYTALEVQAANFKNVHVFNNQFIGEPMDLVLGNTISGLSRYVHETRPDMIVVHGDRVEALAGASVGALRNILVAHIEGGELSGTVDEIIRHAVSKLSHIHFVSNDDARRRLVQLGEAEDSIFIIGSPDLEVMLSPELPTLDMAKEYYDIGFDPYAIALFHPVTTELDRMHDHVAQFVSALVESGRNYVVIYPNNDEGSSAILHEYQKLRNHPRFCLFPSVRFEYFLTLMKAAEFVIGNSSAGVREAPFYSVPSVNVGTRQNNRYSGPSVINVDNSRDAILAGITAVGSLGKLDRCNHFGTGRSLDAFMEAITQPTTWTISKQKQFVERNQ